MKQPRIISNDESQDIAPVTPFGAVEFSFDQSQLKKLVEMSAGIKKINSAKDVIGIMPFIRKLREPRLVLDKERKAQKEASNAHGRLVQSEAAKLISIIQVEEDRLQAIRKQFEEAAALVKQKELEAETARKDAHKLKIQRISEIPGQLTKDKANPQDLSDEIGRLNKIDRTTFEEFADQAEGAIDTAISFLGMSYKLAIEKEEQDKIAAEQAESQRVIDENLQEIEDRRLANEKEAERLKKEKADAAQRQADAEEAFKQKAIDDEKAAAQKVIDDAARDKQAIADRKAAVKAEKRRKAMIEKCRPDAEKLSLFAETLRALDVPELNTNQGVVIWIEQDIENLATRIVDTANGMIS